MADTDICNMALSLIGSRSTIDSLSDGSEEAAACSIWYDRLRRMLLRSVHWGFARAQDSLTQVGSYADNTSPYPWHFKYQYLPNCLTVRYLLPPTPPINSSVVITNGSLSPDWSCTPSRANAFAIANDRNGAGQQSRVILTDVMSAQAVYTIDVTDTDLMDDLFTTALSNMLAYHIVIALTGNAGEKQAYQAATQDAVASARASDANEAMPRSDVLPDWLAVRGTGDAINYGLPGVLWFAPWEEIGWSG